MKKFRFIIILAVFILSVSACKKEDDNNDEQAAIDKALIEAYISDNQLNAQSTASGLYYVIRESGNDEHPTVYSTITVAYKGYLLNGEVFDEDLAFIYNLSKLIQGWKEGIPLIGKGGKIKLMVPSALGYGSQAQNGIPANSVLVFDITLYNFTN
ncbi:MAG: FKBP-type peptidyl-prolyl cis-trans isomerase [Bacteroidetes bacterium]|nr:FKBP-type peptidyl-prolyl cis-trans isomerase [Bacteroidota bacterium]